ncbi:hypothetical protein MKW94_028610 [Papaver nudicaule]|uniref:Uncharacterized protein n=1 Tax=Papaver nudicaule TaxID=74823 RepID=A0AA41V6P5_PAPNU|nr:hypothetical protein [Papaver nudicaule]MCL7032781.1 hypothetical protein [Papaver nudicaule]
MATTCDDQVKTQWPELVGKLGDTAKETIEKENPGLRQVVIVLDGSATDKAYFEDRVRVWVNESNVVIRVPKVG